MITLVISRTRSNTRFLSFRFKGLERPPSVRGGHVFFFFVPRLCRVDDFIFITMVSLVVTPFHSKARDRAEELAECV